MRTASGRFHHKPPRWGLDPSRVAPIWRPYWDDAYWMPVWEQSGGSHGPMVFSKRGTLISNNTGSSWVRTPMGVALEDTAADQEVRYESIPAWMKPTDGATLIWVGEAGTCSTMTGLWGVYYDNAGGSPYATYLMARPSDSTSMGLWCNSTGTWQNVAVTNGILNDGDVHTYVAVIKKSIGGDNYGRLWRDGEYIGAVGYTSGLIQYASTATITLMGHSGATDRQPNAQTLLAGAIMRPLNDNEALALSQLLHRQPFGVITPVHRQASVPSQALSESLFRFRWFEDDAAQGSATPLANEDVNATVAPDTTARLRVGVKGWTGGQAELQGRKKVGGNWGKVDPG